MAKINKDKRTALKLLNKYADSYNILTNENNYLRNENKDLKANIKINKEIIQTFINAPNNEKAYKVIQQLNEENKTLLTQLETTNKERDLLQQKVKS